MPRPNGITLTTLTFGAASTVVTGADVAIRLTITPTTDLVWAATGDVLVATSEVVTADPGAYGVVNLPNPDQAGFQDGNGNTIRNWAYNTVREYLLNGQVIDKQSKYISWGAATASFDLDEMIPITTSSTVVVSIPQGSGLTDAGVAALVENLGTATGAALAATYLPGAAPAGARAGGYDRRLNVYNLKPKHLRNTRSALAQAAAGTSYARIGFIGDSTTEGIGISSPAAQVTQAWPAQFCTLLAGRGYPNNAGPGIVPATTNNAGVWPQWTFSGFTQFNPASSFIIAAASGNTATFTSTTAGTSALVYYLNTGGSFTIGIDGATTGANFATINPDGSPSVGLKVITGLSNTTHTVLITSTSGNAQILSAGIANGSAGVLAYNYGLGGSKSGDWAAPANWYRNSFLLGQAWPHLTFLMLGVNDYGNGITAATYKTNMQHLIDDLKAAYSDIVLVTPVPYSSNDMSAFTSVLYDLADSNDLPLIDLADRWGAPAMNPLNYSGSDYLHPSAAGYVDIAHAAVNALAL